MKDRDRVSQIAIDSFVDNATSIVRTSMDVLKWGLMNRLDTAGINFNAVPGLPELFQEDSLAMNSFSGLRIYASTIRIMLISWWIQLLHLRLLLGKRIGALMVKHVHVFIVSVASPSNPWAEFVGSILCSERFFSRHSGFPLSSKTNIWFDLIYLELIWFSLPN